MRNDDRKAEYLQVLGLSRESSWEAIQVRYRHMVLSHHPDLHPADLQAAQRFREVVASYSALAALRREGAASSPESLRQMCRDPRLRALGPQELGLRLLHSSSSWVRAGAAYLLGNTDQPESRGLLKRAIQDPEPQVRRVAVESLARIGRPGDLLGFALSGLFRRGLPPLTLARSALAIWERMLRSAVRRSLRTIGVWR